MIKVNPIFINEFLSPLIGGADDEDSIKTFSKFRSDNAEEVKKLAELILLPEFKKQKSILQSVSKDTLAFYLTHPDKINFESIFNSLLTPIDTPKDSVLFFQWLWDAFFLNESKDYIKDKKVLEDFDINAPLNLLRNSR